VEPEIACKNGLITTPDGDLRAFRPAYYSALAGNGKILPFSTHNQIRKIYLFL
jgi:hypothetical protein